MSATEQWVPEALDEQEAYLREREGTLHRTVVVSSPDPDADDTFTCGTCGADVRNLACCPDAPLARCGCALWMVRDNEHLPHA